MSGPAAPYRNRLWWFLAERALLRHHLRSIYNSYYCHYYFNNTPLRSFMERQLFLGAEALPILGLGIWLRLTQAGRERGREVGWLRWRKWTLFQRFSVVLRVERSLTAYSHPQIIFSSFLSLLQLLQSLCCASLQTEARRNARARASTLRTDGRGTEKARWDFTLASVQKEISYRRCVHTGLVRENYLKKVCQKTKTKIINVLVFTYQNFES